MVDYKDIEKELVNGEKVLKEMERSCEKLLDLIKKQEIINEENIERVSKAIEVISKNKYMSVQVVLEKGFAEEILNESNNFMNLVNEYINILANLGIINIKKK